jgi:hypothetical protein
MACAFGVGKFARSNSGTAGIFFRVKAKSHHQGFTQPPIYWRINSSRDWRGACSLVYLWGLRVLLAFAVLVIAFFDLGLGIAAGTSATPHVDWALAPSN